jgi:pSer/pThr/pTyr-binding forkhead associated (FHA) protein
MSAITLTLLLPGKSVPVQSWTFDSESKIRIGRAADNDVVLYSAVVSRHHLELRLENGVWVAVNLGANGTYVEGHAVENLTVEDGVLLRLASSGPKIKVNLQPELSVMEKEIVRQNEITDGQEAESHGDAPHHLHPGDSRETIIS